MCIPLLAAASPALMVGKKLFGGGGGKSKRQPQQAVPMQTQGTVGPSPSSMPAAASTASAGGGY